MGSTGVLDIRASVWVLKGQDALFGNTAPEMRGCLWETVHFLHQNHGIILVGEGP